MYIMNNLQKLIDIGFVKAGKWTRNESVIKFSLTDCAESRNVLYCFVSDGVVLYLGKTITLLKRRLYGYQNPGPTQSTNINGNRNINSLIADGKEVDIYALPDNGLLHFGCFHINLAAGLEDSIIKTIHPLWNKTGTFQNQKEAEQDETQQPPLAALSATSPVL